MMIPSTGSTGRRFGLVALVATAGLALSACQNADANSTAATDEAKADQQPPKQLVQMMPYKGYMQAHKNLENPPDLLGGPVRVEVRQTSGGVHVGLPDRRELDADVFGTPKFPRAFAGTPGINGMPPMARTRKGGGWGTTKKMTPFGDKNVVMGGGEMMLKATDVTAVDGAKTRDRVKFRASWQDKQGNTYAVECCKMMASHGTEYPTFGGVVTNHILHGSSRIGSALMPTEYTYVAFWGMGRVLKNGEVQAAPRLVHGMLTEYVRGENYRLVKDSGVTPTRKHFHLMVPPMMPDMKDQAPGGFVHRDLPTGFTLPNGMELPFWHVMLGNLDIQASRGS